MEKFKHNKTLFAAVLLFFLATSAYAVSPKVDKTASAKGRSPRVLLQKAIYAETTEGDLDKAIEIYQEVIERADKIEEIAARATYQLGMCYLKKGEKNKAAEYFQQAVSNYPTQKSIAKKAQKQLSNLQLPVANSIPMVIAASPTVYANDVSPSLDKINVTFNQPMMDGSWSWTGGGETFPEVTGKIHYNYSKTTCTLPVKLKAGNVYWIGINSPSHKNFKTQQRVPAKRYVIIFATKDKNGNATPIPKDRLARAKAINSASDKAAGWKEIYLPDADDVIQQGKAAVVLDLKTGKMLPGDKDKRYFNKLNKGDVAYADDEGLDLLVCFRGAKITRKTANGKYSDTPDQSHTDNTIHIYIIKKTPAEWTITTKEGDSYDLRVLSLDNSQAKIKYRKMSGLSNAKRVSGKITDPKEAGKIVKNAILTISTCTESDPKVARSLKKLETLDEKAAVSEIAKYLDSDEPTVRRSAIFVLWRGEFDSIAPAEQKLLELCSHDESFTRGMAAIALGAARVPASFETLTDMTLNDADGYARRCSAYALGLYGDEKALEVLNKALQDKDPMVKQNAQAAIIMLTELKETQN